MSERGLWSQMDPILNIGSIATFVTLYKIVVLTESQFLCLDSEVNNSLLIGFMRIK